MAAYVLQKCLTRLELSIIKNHCQIELVIDDLTNKLKSQVFDRIPSSIQPNRLDSSFVGYRPDTNGSETSNEDIHKHPNTVKTSLLVPSTNAGTMHGPGFLNGSGILTATIQVSPEIEYFKN